MKHYATPNFWARYELLPSSIQKLADKQYELLKANPAHRSLRFKKVGELWSVRIGIRYRALGVDVDGGILWIWIGTHEDYDKVIA